MTTQTLKEQVNRRDLVKAIAAQTGVDAKTVDAVLKGFTDVTTAVVSKGEPVAITGFAKFSMRRGRSHGSQPGTGEVIKIKASKKARITPLKGFKDAVMTPSTAPKLAKGVWPPAAKKARTGQEGRRQEGGTGQEGPGQEGPARKAPARR